LINSAAEPICRTGKCGRYVERHVRKGETEKHVIKVNTSIFWKRITIEINGKTMVNEYSYSPAPKEFKFDVGTSEKLPWK